MSLYSLYKTPTEFHRITTLVGTVAIITITFLILFNILHKPASCKQLEFSQEECSLWYHSGKDGNCTKSLSDINNETCGQFNREGVLCSKCMDGYGLPFSSYNISCVFCKYSWYNWMKYLATTYLPLTIFVFIVIIFRFSANSGSMVVYVTLSQLMINKNIASLYILIHYEIHTKVVAALYSMWNMEFLNAFTFSCLHPDLSALQILALDYLVALYPMILVFLTYMLVYWHGRSQMVVYTLALLQKRMGYWQFPH